MLTVAVMPVQAVALVFGAPMSRRLPGIYHRLCARLMGFDIGVRGKVVTEAPALFVGNHSSYLDIMILSTIIDGCFIAKAEIAQWPLFGWLSKLQRTVFIERRSPQTARQRDEIGKRLDAGDRLILFPEGTSNDGALILPFKSALFAVAERPVAGKPLVVQPFSLAYTELEGLPIGREWRPLLAWYGDMGLQSHFWRVATFGRIRVEVRFHEPITIDQYGGRKALAAHCHDVVRNGVAAANSGASYLEVKG